MLEAAGKLQRYQPLLARVGELTLMAGAVRALMNLLVLLAVIIAVDAWTPDDWPSLAKYPLAFVLAGVLVSVFTVAIPAAHGP